MKRIALIGASGFIGSALLKEAIGRGIHVTAIVRNPGKIAIRHPKLTIEVVDVMDTDLLSRKLTGINAVISAYNPGWTSPNIAEDTLKGYPSILCAVKKSGINRFLVVGGAGSLLLPSGVQLMDSGAIPTAYLPIVKSLASFYTDFLKPEKEVDWVYFCPAGDISPGVRTAKFRLGLDDLIVGTDGKSRISVEDYAVAMLDEFEHPAHHRQRMTIGY